MRKEWSSRGFILRAVECEASYFACFLKWLKFKKQTIVPQKKETHPTYTTNWFWLVSRGGRRQLSSLAVPYLFFYAGNSHFVIKIIGYRSRPWLHKQTWWQPPHAPKVPRWPEGLSCFRTLCQSGGGRETLSLPVGRPLSSSFSLTAPLISVVNSSPF